MSEKFSYFTIEKPTESLYREKGSRFLGFVFPVFSQSEIKERLDELKEIHPKATHHCYAWRLGLDENLYRINDDGEPSGTAGRPMLGQIDKLNLTNCLVVSIRYYGGTKLGVPGLISAYKTNAQETLELATVVEKELTQNFLLTCSYDNLNTAYQWIQHHEGQILNQEMTDSCTFQVQIPLRLKERALESKENYYPLSIEEEDMEF